jgi:hypothetical protein
MDALTPERRNVPRMDLCGYSSATLPRMTRESWPPSSRPEPRRAWAKRAGITVAIILAVATLLCCAGISYFAYDLHRAPEEEKAIEAFAQVLCADLVAGNDDAVYLTLSSDARQRYSREVLAGSLAARPRPTRCEVEDASFLFLLGSYVTVTIAYRTAVAESYGRHTFDLTKEDGQWKVGSDILRDLDSPPRHGGGGGGGD